MEHICGLKPFSITYSFLALKGRVPENNCFQTGFYERLLDKIPFSAIFHPKISLGKN